MIGLWVSLAGGVGAGARFAVDGAARRWVGEAFPFGTFAINVSGSFLLGLLVGLVRWHGASGDLGSIAGTGFCGGYTTFSAASFEAVRLAERRRWIACAAHAGGSLLASLLAAGAGLAVAGHW